MMSEFYEKVKLKYENYSKGHDFTHIERVLENALKINQVEQESNKLVTILALVHDLYDEKFNNTVNIELEFRELIKDLNLKEEEIETLILDLQNFGFKGGFNQPQLSKIGQIVSDADRLDAIGAIGIARTMMYGSVLYNKQKYQEAKTIQEYRDSQRPILFHFYDKLLKIKDLMFTETGKKLAQERHDFMVQYLQQLKSEIGDDLF